MKRNSPYTKLADFGRKLLDKKSLVEGLPLISTYAKDVIGAKRCSIFIYDEKACQLWTTIADGIEKITIPCDKGIVGYTLSEKKPLVVNEPYKHPKFLAEIDAESGYKTHNLITAPIFNSRREIIGILELLNKEEEFDNEDMKFMIFFAHYVSGFLELTNIYLNEEKNKTKKGK